MVSYRAAWVVPISRPPIRGGAVTVHNGRITEVGPAAGGSIDLGDVALMPGLVNAHTHLELSYMRGQVPASPEFIAWIRTIVAERRKYQPLAPEILQGLADGIADAVACGTALAGDISNTLVGLDLLSSSPLAAVVYHELIRFRAPDPNAFVAEAIHRIRSLPATDDLRTSLAAHAPYSVSPGVFRALRAALDRGSVPSISVHLSESEEEVEFVRAGSGPWRTFLEEIGAWDAEWTPCGSSPVAYLDAHGFFDSRVLAVHGVQMSPADLRRLAERQATLVTCPRSNRYTGAGTPPIDAFYRSGVRVAVGTDSLASTPDLNVFSELAEMRKLAPAVPPSAFLESATRQGAEALGFGGDFGTLDPGKRARFLAVTVPPGTGDVEEYLVSGIRSDAIRWVE
jgi:cytosine/adenosine deaminase-related metal-dependent hydrolase